MTTKQTPNAPQSTLPPSQAALASRRPVSEALLNEKWDRLVSSMVVRSTIGFTFGVVFSVLLFKRRAWPVWTGVGFGAGRAYEEADYSFRNGGVKSSNKTAQK